MRRRQIIAAVCAGVACPIAGRAQQVHERRRLGVLFGEARDAVSEGNLAVLKQALRDLGWMENVNLQVEARWGSGNLEQIREFAAELLTLKPDVVFTAGIRALDEQRRRDDITPIVFTATTDPVAQGFAQSLARPGGQTTGFLIFEFSVIGKLLDGLKEIAPQHRRAALFINPANRSTAMHARAFEAAARASGLEPAVVRVRERAEIEPALAAYGAGEPGGLIVPPDVFMLANRDQLVAAAMRNRVPLIVAERELVRAGALMSYGVNRTVLYHNVAGYLDRILRGTPPGVLPIQAPTRFDLLINLKAAQALDLAVPPTLLARADEVID